MKTLTFIISIFFYLIGVGGLFYIILWMGGFVPPSIYAEATGPISTAVLTNLGLLVLFSIQHSGMARKSTKERTASIIPPHFQRSLYVMVSGVLCAAIAFFWQPLPGTIWKVPAESVWTTILHVGFFLGVGVLLLSSFLINHFELFGLQQTYLNMRNKEKSLSTFKEILLYRIVRHPIYLGFTMVLWITPHMNMTHFMLTLGMMAYIFIGIYFEEKDLISEFGSKYLEYKSRVPAILPFLKWKKKATANGSPYKTSPENQYAMKDAFRKEVQNMKPELNPSK